MFKVFRRGRFGQATAINTRSQSLSMHKTKKIQETSAMTITPARRQLTYCQCPRCKATYTKMQLQQTIFIEQVKAMAARHSAKTYKNDDVAIRGLSRDRPLRQICNACNNFLRQHSNRNVIA